MIDKKRAHLYPNEKRIERRKQMRRKLDLQLYFNCWPGSRSSVVKKYEGKYSRIGQILEDNPEILTLVDRDLKKLSIPGKRGRKATYPTEILFRTILVHHLEGKSLRGTEILLTHSIFLQDFVRLGPREVPSYSMIGRAVKALRPQTWERVNEVLARYALEKKRIDPSKLRADTTVVETNIHYPTDTSLLWDSYRVLYRLIERVREYSPGEIPQRFHERKVKKLHLFITRHSRSPSKKRQRKVRKYKAKLIQEVKRIYDVCAEFALKVESHPDWVLCGFGKEIQSFLGSITKVLDAVERAWIYGEVVPAEERIFSIFEDHTELIKRGRRHKPVEFGHAVLLGQTKEKFITQYRVMKKKISDSRLPEHILEEHKRVFGSEPETLAADKGFCGDPQTMEELRKKVKFVAIPQRLKDFADEFFVMLQHFRAGIEGTISVLKRAFGLLRCQYRGFKSFASFVGLAIFTHNLVILAKPPD